MDPRTNDQIRTRLLRRRDELLGEGDVDIEPLKDDPTKKIDEDAAPLAEMEQVIASNRNRARAQQLQQIDLALVRLGEEPEDFGLCESCDEPIPMRRLELMPWARLCAACQQEQESSDAPGTRKHLTDYR
ncbi:MAG: TraR/DksA family transcriptional regulator [Myxococcales bacterium]|nr:TraR/DksA family transcriptional regulator [Myxococcales bacterium]MCB9714196.1 TraR/DksA family transcriptional regulator [Myxococcales bacterium]